MSLKQHFLGGADAEHNLNKERPAAQKEWFSAHTMKFEHSENQVVPTAGNNRKHILTDEHKTYVNTDLI